MRNLLRLAIRFLYNKADLVVTVSRAIADDLVSTYGVRRHKVQVIYNPCDVKNIAVRSREPIKFHYETIFESEVIITVGRLVVQKGLWHLIRAFRKVRDSLSKVNLVIIGEGVNGVYLKSLTQALELESSVYFLGFKNNPFKYMARATVFVLSSLVEGLPCVLLEAMACQLPVISTDCTSGPREILAPGTHEIQTERPEFAEYGVLVPVFDGLYKRSDEPITREESILATVMIDMLRNHQLRRKYSDLSYRRVLHFNMKVFTNKWSRTIGDLCK
jgi:glycosyltransferase involved in cell wall biosynthesis